MSFSIDDTVLVQRPVLPAATGDCGGLSVVSVTQRTLGFCRESLRAALEKSAWVTERLPTVSTVPPWASVGVERRSAVRHAPSPAEMLVRSAGFTYREVKKCIELGVDLKQTARV